MELLSEKGMQGMIEKYKIKVKNSAALKQAFAQIIKKCTQQSGGDGHEGLTVLPSEYFGKDSGRYFDTVTSTSMGVTEELSRPAMTMTAGGDAYIVSAYKMASMVKGKSRAKAMADKVNAKAHQFMSLAVDEIKNKDRLLGDSHIAKAMRKMSW